MWELYPGHPNLLEARFDGPGPLTSWVRKPLLGREGANITMHRPESDFETDGEYGSEGFVYQDLARIGSFDGKYPVVGSWVIGHEPGNAAAGIGIREVGHAHHYQPQPVRAALVRLSRERSC